MCKTWDLIYSCGHTFHFRLSKCRATVYTQSRPGRPFRPACLGDPALRFNKAYACGDCQSKDKVQELNNLCNSFEVGTLLRDAADAEAGKELLKLSKAYPILERRKRGKPHQECGLPPKKLRGSLLKTEVLGQDVVVAAEEDSEDWTAYYDEWGQGWTTSPDAGEAVPSWESADTSLEESSVAWALEEVSAAYEKEGGNPWADDSEEVESDLNSVAACDAQISIDEPSTGLETEEDNVQITPTHDDQIEDQSTTTPDTSDAHRLLQELPNGTSTTHSQTTAPTKELNSSCSAPATPTSATFSVSHDQTTSPEKYKFKTLPPHLRHRVVSFNKRRASTSEYSDSELLDVLEQFKFFQLQTVITLST